MNSDRGWLKIDHTVVKKVAQHAVDRVPGIAAERRGPAGIGRSQGGSSARIQGEGNNVDLALDLALHYPASVRSVIADVREQVTAEIERVTSYRVRTIAITVSALEPDIPPRVR